MKKILFLVVTLIFSVLIVFSLYSSGNKREVSESFFPRPGEKVEKQNIKASFAIFTNNTKRVFTDPKYHNQSKDAYMEEANIVIVKKTGTVWDNFFKTLPMKLTKDCLTTGTGQIFCGDGSGKLRFFINGIEDRDALEKEIKNGDKLLVSYGSKTEDEIKSELEQVPTVD
ncbi:MAG: hypothetical protein A2798_00680 [Candidatus Levybacteria bacterium RIFCSPHIGHO2_01_FULL_37_17]|nr:MAG: hypothetical protein A2798_00680 [Candidatus Levybacteria bacterium RIFCSPHIGHO2_01_FULL_37_17]OGH36969.1 MAG: hypothetical protein A2959_01540 [Candidatus Levybacteria bacterium RIFCSPLOWO2_01_FULL_38_23]